MAKEQHYISWKRSMEAQLAHEKVLFEEAEKIFKSGGRVEEAPVKNKKGEVLKNKDGSPKRGLIIRYGRYTPKIKISPKSLVKLGLLVVEVKEIEKRRARRKQQKKV